MASHDAASGPTSNGDNALQEARRRRIDDVRHLQKQRRRQRSVEPHRQRQNQTQPQHYELLSEEEIYNMHQHSQHEMMNTNYHQDQDTATMAMASSPSRSHVSHASSSMRSRSTTTRRGALSAKRQNMMQRRIEMRRRNEERERHQQQATGARQQEEVEYSLTATATDSRDHGDAAADTAEHQHHRQNQESLLQPQHSQHQQQSSQHQPVPQQYTHSQPHSRPIMNYQQQQQQQQQSGGNSHQSQDELMGQQQQQSYNTQPQQRHHQQQQLPPMQQIRQQYHPQQQQQQPPPTLQYYNQQQQQQQGNPYSTSLHSHTIQSHQQQQQQQQPSPPGPPPPPSNTNNPMTIPSPPMLQRRQQFASSIPIYHTNTTTNNNNNHHHTIDNHHTNNPHLISHHGGGGGGGGEELSLNSHQRVYHNGHGHGQSGLDILGIIRTTTPNVNSQRGQLMKLNRLKSHDSPSDEWHTTTSGSGGNGNTTSHRHGHGHGRVNTTNQTTTYQYQKKPQQQLLNQQQQQQQQQHHHDRTTTEQNVHNNNLVYSTDTVERVAQQQQQHQQQQYQVRNDSTLKEVNPHWNQFSNVPTLQLQQQQQQPARKQHGPKLQQPSPNNQNQQQPQQPNWNDINQQYHDMNRQMHYQRQMELKHEQQQQQQQMQTMSQNNNKGAAEEGEGEGLHNTTTIMSSKSPHRQPRMAAQSPVEHLGNRTENIQWKNNGGNNVMPRSRPPQGSGQRGMQQQQQQTTGPQHFQQPVLPQGDDVYGTPAAADGDESIASVSEQQARNFQHGGKKAGERSRSTGRGGGGGRVSSVPVHTNNYQSNNNADEEGTVDTMSVASLRKGWERQQQQQQQHKPRAKSAGRLERSTPNQHPHAAAAPPTKTSSVEYHDHNNKGESPFGVWEERANRLARVRRRDQRREQRKTIEDRWNNASSGGGVGKRSGSLPPPEKRRIGGGGMQQQQQKMQQEQRQGMVGGYQSEGPARQRASAMRANRDRYPTDGYQSEGPPQRRREDQHHEQEEVYQSKSQEAAANRGGVQQVQQIQYNEEVDSALITPRDARRRLWDTKERLRADLPRNESFDDIGNVRDRWSEHHEEEGNAAQQHQTHHHHHGNNKTRYHHSQSPHSRISGFGSPSNYSGISAASSGRFKSKFVHAAAVAAQKRVEDASRQRQYEEARFQEQRHHQQQQKANEFVEEDQEDDLEEFNPDLMQVQQQLHHHENMSKSKHHHPHKDHAMNSSHYTDSTDETTKDLTTPGGSHASSNVRRVSRSPPQRPMQPGATSSIMPSISEAAPAQVETHTSVAALISRINAVSRSNPAEALAAIDSIIKREGGIAGGSGNQVQQVEVARTPSKQDLLSSNISAAVTPSPSERVNADGVVKHLGKEFFQERYEEVIHSTAPTGVVTKELHMGAVPGATAKELQRFNSELAVRGSMEMRGSHERDATENDRRNEHDEEDDDDYDSLLSSSDDSTVSSMTNPTYQSLKPQQHKEWKRLQGQSSERQPPPVQVTSRNKQARHQPDQKLPDKPQKSWNTLKQEYNTRRSPSPIVQTAISKARSSSSQGASSKQSSPAVQQDISKTHTTSHDIGVDTYGLDDEIEFNPDDIDLVDNSPPNTIPKSNTDDFAPGFCGMSYNVSASQSDTKKSGAEAEPPRLKPSSSTATSAWTPFGTGTNNSNDDKGRRREKTAKNVRSARPAVQGKPRPGNANWPFMGESPQPKQDTSRKEKSAKNMPSLVDRQGAKNKMAASSSQARRQSQASLHGGDTMPTRSATPESKNKQPKRASTPEIMMAVTDAFSNVDISLDGTSRNMVDVDPPLEQLDSRESKQSLHSISEAFSDVDVDFGQEKTTVSQRRAELERLSKSWVMSKTFSNDSSGSSSSFKVPPRKNDAEPPQSKNKASWANKPQQQAQKASRFTIKKPKIPEPKLRLKGNKSLAQKFANLVDAFED